MTKVFCTFFLRTTNFICTNLHKNIIFEKLKNIAFYKLKNNFHQAWDAECHNLKTNVQRNEEKLTCNLFWLSSYKFAVAALLTAHVKNSE